VVKLIVKTHLRFSSNAILECFYDKGYI